MASNDKRVHDKNTLIIILVTAAFVLMIFMPYQVGAYHKISWIKQILIGLIVVSSIAWLKSYGSLRQPAKHLLVIVSIFAISFSAVEGYMMYNAGYPPIFDSSHSDNAFVYTNKLDVSLIDLVQNVKDTPAFKLLMLEYPGNVSVERILLNDQHVRIVCILGRLNLAFSFDSVNGAPYHVSFLGTRSSRQQIDDNVLHQIDTLGLQWYYNSVIEACQNEIEIVPEINNLSLFIVGVNSFSDNSEVQLQLSGSYRHEGDSYQRVFSAIFYSNGTLIALNYPNMPEIKKS